MRHGQYDTEGIRSSEGLAGDHTQSGEGGVSCTHDQGRAAIHSGDTQPQESPRLGIGQHKNPRHDDGVVRAGDNARRRRLPTWRGGRAPQAARRGDRGH